MEPPKRRRPGLVRRSLSSKLKPDRVYRVPPIPGFDGKPIRTREHVQRLALVLDPASFMIPTRRKIQAVSELVEELATKGWVMELTIIRKAGGPPAKELQITPQGIAELAINRYLLQSRKPFTSLPHETQERLAHYFIINQIMGIDFDPKTRTYETNHSLSRAAMITRLRQLSNLRALRQATLENFGPQEKWTPDQQSFFDFRYQHALLAARAIVVAGNQKRWKHWMDLRAKHTLYTELPGKIRTP